MIIDTRISVHCSLSRLLLYGMVCCLDEKYDMAADLFEMATTLDPSNIIAWTMRGWNSAILCDSVWEQGPKC